MADHIVDGLRALVGDVVGATEPVPAWVTWPAALDSRLRGIVIDEIGGGAQLPILRRLRLEQRSADRCHDDLVILASERFDSGSESVLHIELGFDDDPRSCAVFDVALVRSWALGGRDERNGDGNL